MKAPERHPSDLLAAHAGEELETRTKARVSEHLLVCGTCRAERERWRNLYGELRRLPRPAPSAGLRDRILFAVAVEARQRARQAESLRRRLMQALSWGYASGMGLAGVATVLLLLVPEARTMAAGALAAASSFGLRAGLVVFDVASAGYTTTRGVAASIFERVEWVETLARALGAAGDASEVRWALGAAFVLTLFLTPTLVAGGLPRRRSNREMPHVGALLG